MLGFNPKPKIEICNGHTLAEPRDLKLFNNVYVLQLASIHSENCNVAGALTAMAPTGAAVVTFTASGTWVLGCGAMREF